MTLVTGGTTRTRLSDVLKGVNAFENDAYVNFCVASAAVKAASSTTTDNIGIPLKWNSTTSAYNIFTANADWAVDTVTAVGNVVKPTTQDGFEYVCIAISSDAKTHATTEPTWPALVGATIVDDAVTWLCRDAYTGTAGSLPDGSEIAILIGAKEGAGVNTTDTTIGTTAVSMPMLYRGPAAVVEDGFTWGSVAEADQDEFYAALEKKGITVITSGTTVAPTFA